MGTNDNDDARRAEGARRASSSITGLQVFVAALGAETNTFSPIPTDLAAFTDSLLWRPGEHPDAPFEQTAPLWVARDYARTHGWRLVEGTCAHAPPGGIVPRAVYETLRDEILEQLAGAGRLDVVLLAMHGAMVAGGYADCEGDTLLRVREIVGPDVVIGVQIDPHAHLSEAMVSAADVIVAFREYPHTDFVERATELVEIVLAVRTGRITPVMLVSDCRMIDVFHTPVEPMRGFLTSLRSLEGTDGVVSISVIHGFPWGDVQDMGTKILVITDNDARHGQELAAMLAAELFALRGRAAAEQVSLSEALARLPADTARPVVWADSADNPGGGAAGDSTFILRELLARAVTRCAIGPVWDPLAVRIARAAGTGARLKLRIGGKAGQMSGEPLDVSCTVTCASEHGWQSFAGSRVSLGATAAIDIDGIHVVLSSARAQALHPDLFRNMRIEPTEMRLVVVKSSQHFYAGFSGLAAGIVYVGAGGALSRTLNPADYAHVRRPRWPFDPAAECAVAERATL